MWLGYNYCRDAFLVVNHLYQVHTARTLPVSGTMYSLVVSWVGVNAIHQYKVEHPGW